MKRDFGELPNKPVLNSRMPNPADKAEFEEPAIPISPVPPSDGEARPGSERDKLGKSVAVPVRTDEPGAPFFAPPKAQSLRSAWENIQIGFVDDPKNSVEQADRLVAEGVEHLAQAFAAESQRLEHQWNREDGVSTEDLRLLLRRYRSFFERLVSI